MEHLERTVSTLTVKELQKQLNKAGVNLRGKYKEEKPYYVRQLIEELKVSLRFPQFSKECFVVNSLDRGGQVRWRDGEEHCSQDEQRDHECGRRPLL